MEKCATTMTMYVNMHQQGIHPNLISPVRNSISGQQPAETVSFWGPIFSMVMLLVLPRSGRSMNPFTTNGCTFWKPVLGRPFSKCLVGTRRYTAPSYWCASRLNDVFGHNHVVGLGHDVEWPPRSPDLTPCDFFLWGYLRNTDSFL